MTQSIQTRQRWEAIMSQKGARPSAVQKEYDALLNEALRPIVGPHRELRFRILNKEEQRTVLRKLSAAYCISGSPALLRLMKSLEQHCGR